MADRKLLASPRAPRSAESQLDFLATFKPPEQSMEEWDLQVQACVWTASYMLALSRRCVGVGTQVHCCSAVDCRHSVKCELACKLRPIKIHKVARLPILLVTAACSLINAQLACRVTVTP